MNLAEIRKALVPLAIAGILAAASAAGFSEQMTLGDFVTAVVTAVGVYLIPNRR